MDLAKSPTGILGVILVIAIVVSGFFYVQYQRTQSELRKIKENPRAVSQEETKKLVDMVGKLAELPQGEDPTIAVVTNKDRLRDQPFFARAENGDQLLIYTQARKAFLYRGSTNKIIEIAPVNIGTSSASPIATPSATPST